MESPRALGLAGEVRRLLADGIDFLLPQACIACGRFGASLHDECIESLPRADGSRCLVCWRPTRGSWCERCSATAGAPDAFGFDGLRAIFRFEGDARRALLEAKFRGVTAHLGPLGRAAAGAVPSEWRFEAILGVPLARRRERERGYNQAALLAREVARVLGVPEARGLVSRTRSTPPQAGLSAEERAHNLEGAFAVRGTPPRGVLVVDDVTTTGATLSAVARALKAAGSERVYALAAARED